LKQFDGGAEIDLNLTFDLARRQLKERCAILDRRAHDKHVKSTEGVLRRSYASGCFTGQGEIRRYGDAAPAALRNFARGVLCGLRLAKSDVGLRRVVNGDIGSRIGEDSYDLTADAHTSARDERAPSRHGKAGRDRFRILHLDSAMRHLTLQLRL
jgi:hypothetical protein